MPRIQLDEIINKPLRFLWYGHAGSGKTHLCGSVVDVDDMLPMFFADTDGGLKTVEQTFLNAGDDKVVVWKVVGEEDVKALNDALFSPTSPYKTVTLDSMTAFYDILMDMHLRSVHKAGQSPQIQDYGAVGSTIQAWLNRIKNRPKGPHFITTAGEMFTKDEVTGVIYIEPDFTGKLTKRIPKYFDMVGCITSHVKVTGQEGEVTSTERRMQVQPYRNVRAKDRTPNSPFGAMIVNPTMKYIYEGAMGRIPSKSEDTKSAPTKKVTSNTEVKEEKKNA